MQSNSEAEGHGVGIGQCADEKHKCRLLGSSWASSGTERQLIGPSAGEKDKCRLPGASWAGSCTKTSVARSATVAKPDQVMQSERCLLSDWWVGPASPDPAKTPWSWSLLR